MPTYVLKCENCGGQKPFLVHEGELAGAGGTGPVQRHCPTCRTMTSWLPSFPERRDGRERRGGTDRRLVE